jgi:hypothetical protein
MVNLTFRSILRLVSIIDTLYEMSTMNVGKSRWIGEV